MSRRASLLRHAWAQTALWVVAVALIGHLSAARFTRLDLTHDQRHSVSDVARRAVSDLQRPLIARVYFSSDLQPPYHDHRRVLLDLLDELAAWSSGQLEVQVVDPGDDPTLAAEAVRAGIQPVPYVFRAHDRQEARTVYMGVAFQYGERQSVAPALPSLPHLEEEVVRALRRVIVPPDERRAVGWIVGHGEPDPRTLPEGSPLIALRDELGSTRSLRSVELARPLPPELDLLLLVAPRERLSEVELLRLDQHVMEGGALVAFLSGYQPDFQSGRARELDHGLHDLLRSWGVTPERALILDRADNERLALPMRVPGSGARWVQVHHPLAPATTHLDRGHPAVRDLGRLVLPFVTPLSVSDPLPPGVEVEVWAESGPSSVAVGGEPTLEPSVLARPLPGERGGPHPVVASLSGRLPSAWAGQEPPQGSERTADELIAVSRPVRVVVVGSGDAAANSTDLVLSAVDWALQDPDLLEAVRDRGARDVLEAPAPAVHWQLRLGLTVGPLLLLGLVTLAVRRGVR